MIKTIRVHNFKSLKDTGEIELKPITILAGPNSGGKSSILQSLLLLKQTFESERNISLNLDGSFLQFSGLDELTYGKPPKENCEITYEFKLASEIPREVVSKYFPDFKIPRRKKPEFFTFESKIKVAFREFSDEKGKKLVGPSTFVISSELDKSSGPTLEIRRHGNKYRVITSGKGTTNLNERTRRKITGVDFNNFIPNFFYLKALKGQDTEHYREAIQLDSIFRVPLSFFREEFEGNLKYLGPLREEPRRAYLHSGKQFPDIGQKGQYAAQILYLEQNEKVIYDRHQMNLMTGVSKAFQDIGIIQPINTSSERKIMYQILFGLKDSRSRKKVTIADVGFGISQLLPIVLMGLRSPEQSILIFEQPEIHLHPKLQANLADFFLTLARPGRRIIVETHSDHLINRLRRRIVEDSSDTVKDKVSILFVRPPTKNEGAIIEPLKIDRYGVIENWPPDFLPEALDEAETIFRKGLEKRKAE